MSIRAVLTDIEGTTSSIEFVHRVLFPYSAQQLPDYLRAAENRTAVSSLLDALAQHPDYLAAFPASVQSESFDRTAAATTLLLDWIREDRKEPILKSLQGKLWKQGYEQGAYRAHVYSDVLPALARWSERNLLIAVYSSGSIAAQKLFFRHSVEGDLSRFFCDYFDTTSGPKRDAESYQHIARALGFLPGQMLFLSDIAAELDAAKRAGFAVCGLQREGSELICAHPVVGSFSDINL